MWRLVETGNPVSPWRCRRCGAFNQDEYYCVGIQGRLRQREGCGRIPSHLRVLWDPELRREEVLIFVRVRAIHIEAATLYVESAADEQSAVHFSERPATAAVV